ncbi:proactivator polypeptide-like 1 [Rhynchocyon petersi]
MPPALPALLLLSLLGPAAAAPSTILPECPPGSPEGCWDLHSPPESAEDNVQPLETAARKSNLISVVPAPQACSVCEEVARKVQGQLHGDDAQENIQRALDSVCHSLPWSLQPTCTALLADHGPEMPALLAEEDTPEKVCRSLGVCKARRAAWPHTTRPSTPPSLLDQENQGSFCASCKKLLDVSASNLESKSTKRDILTAFKGGCSILPLPYRVQCGHFVTQYEPVLIESLMTMMDPSTVCKKVGACHGPRNPLLGSEQCVIGPSFWCRSQETAQLCGALEHCQRHVWKEEHE